MNRGEQSNEGERSVTRSESHRDSFRDPFDRLFRLAGFADDGAGRGAAGNAPCIDIDEDDDSYDVTVELPGMKPEEVHVELNQNLLTISGEKRVGFGDEKKQKRSRWSERSYGRFTRSFTLPRDADSDRLEARFTHGVLTISIPKSEASKPRTINVRTS
jgi:HSP20 family protein